MPVYKYKSFEEARKSLWNLNPGKKYYQTLSDFYELHAKLFKKKFPKGVYKYKSFKQAQKQRDEILKGKSR